MGNDEQARAVHRPITIWAESVSKLPDVRELPQDTVVPINIKMNRELANQVVKEIQEQLAVFTGIDFVAITITGKS